MTALPRSAPCITNKYMAASAVITVRIEPELLAALKERAKRDGRSLSAQLVWIVRKEVEAPPKKRGKPIQTMGMFSKSDFEDLALSEFKRLRRKLSEKVRAGVKRRADTL